MNEELIKKIIEYMESSKDFIVEQAPDIIQQMLKYETFNNIFGLIIAVIILFVSIGVFIYGKYSNKTDKIYFNVYNYVSIWLFIAAFAISAFAINNLVKIKISPKYFVIEKLKDKK